MEKEGSSSSSTTAAPLANRTSEPPAPSRAVVESESDASGTSDERDLRKSSDPSSNDVVLPLAVLPSILALWHAGRQQKKSAFEIQNWVKLALTLDGRDKLTKVFQYACRTLSWWYATKKKSSAATAVNSNNYYAIQAERFAEAKGALTNGRKAFRLGRTFIELHRLYSMLVTTASASTAKPKPSTATTTIPPCPASKKSSLLATLTAYALQPEHGSWIDSFGSALKLVGLAGFWAADNASYVAMMGLLDDYSQSKVDRIRKRSQRQATYSTFANRSYFVGAVAGLVVNVRAFVRHQRTVVAPLLEQQEQLQAKQGDVTDETTTRSALSKRIDQARQKQFVNAMALLKSCCDVLVFSNNPGVDLWKKGYVRGTIWRSKSVEDTNRPMHEGLHCLCGLLSAATVLYNNFPDE